MAGKSTSTNEHTHEWMAMTMWLGLVITTLVSTIYIANNFLFSSSTMINLSQLLTQSNLQVPGQEGGGFFSSVILYVILLLFVAAVYFLINAWLRLGSLLLELLIHLSREEDGSSKETIFSTMLYLVNMGDDDDKFDADDAEGSMPGEIIRNLGFSWVSVFLIHLAVTSVPYLA